MSVDNALEFVSGMHQQLNQLKTQEESIRRGLNIFKIDQPPSNIIVILEKVLHMALLYYNNSTVYIKIYPALYYHV